MLNNSFFTSSEFLDNLKFPDDERKLITFINNQISLYITYCTLYHGGEGYKEFLAKQELDFTLDKNSFYHKAVGLLAKDFYKKNENRLGYFFNGEIKLEALFYELYRVVNKNGFHGCSILDDSILKNGLDSSKKDPLNQEYYDLSSKYGFDDGLTGDNLNRIYFSFNPKESTEYAYGSPSWIRFFISQGNAYEMKDYDLALETLKNHLEDYELNGQATDEVLEYFDRIWKTYSKSQPIILKIKNPNELLPYNEFEECCKVLDFTAKPEEIFEKFFHYLLGGSNLFYQKVNNFTNNKVDPEDIEEVYFLPHISMLKEKQKETQNQENGNTKR